MIRYLAFAIVSIGGSVQLAAQQPHAPMPAFTDTAYSGLALTPEQWSGIKELESRYADKIRHLDPLSEEAFNGLRSKREGEIQDILNPDQFRRWKLRGSGQTPPAEMPTMRPKGPVTPMPVQDKDTVQHRMPIVEPDQAPAPH